MKLRICSLAGVIASLLALCGGMEPLAASVVPVPLSPGNTWTLLNSAKTAQIRLSVEWTRQIQSDTLASVRFENPAFTYSLLVRYTSAGAAQGTYMDGFASGGVEYRFPSPAPLFIVTAGSGKPTLGQVWTSALGSVKLTATNKFVSGAAGSFSGCQEYTVSMSDGTVWIWTIAPGTGFVQFGAAPNAFTASSVILITPPAGPPPTAANCPPLGLSSIPWSETLTSADRRNALQAAIASGSKMLSVTAPWSDLESLPGKYDFTRIADELSLGASFNLPTVLTIGSIFSGRSAMPTDLQGRAWSDPVVVSRFVALLSALRPYVPSQTRWLNLGYEVDVYLQGNQTAVTPYLSFLNQVQSAAKAMYPQSIGVVFSFDSVRPGAPTLPALVGFGDHVGFDYYAVASGFQQRDPSSAAADLWLMRHFANGRPVLINEVGYSSASGSGSSPAAQQQFFNNFLGALQQDATGVAGVVAWSLNDMPAAAVTQAATELQAPSTGSAAAFLGSLGLRQSDGTAKPAYGTFVQWSGTLAPSNACQLRP